MKKLFVLLVVLFSVVIIYGLIAFINERAQEKDKEYAFSGVITNIYQDKWNHDMYTFSILINGREEQIPIAVFPKSWEYAIVGDSIIKPKDELYIIIKKHDGSSQFFYYK